MPNFKISAKETRCLLACALRMRMCISDLLRRVFHWRKVIAIFARDTATALRQVNDPMGSIHELGHRLVGYGDD